MSQVIAWQVSSGNIEVSGDSMQVLGVKWWHVKWLSHQIL